MQSQQKELRVDRVEEGLAIAYDAEGNEYCMCARIADLKESDILLASINSDGTVFDVSVLQEKTEENKQALKNKLQKLFNKQGERI